jgi:hypothetical protein
MSSISPLCGSGTVTPGPSLNIPHNHVTHEGGFANAGFTKDSHVLSAVLGKDGEELIVDFCFADGERMHVDNQTGCRKGLEGGI